LLTLSLSAATPKKKAAATLAPDDIAHPMALFLRSLSRDGARTVTFRASATGTHFFLEEPSGVTVYRYANGHYLKETFLGGTKLEPAMKKYVKK
jgi:hypothetical protein